MCKQSAPPHARQPFLITYVDMPHSVLSLDDSDLSSTASSYDEEEWLLAQKEWEESIEQLQQLVGVVLLPFFGKWLGRKWSHIRALYPRRVTPDMSDMLPSVRSIP